MTPPDVVVPALLLPIPLLSLLLSLYNALLHTSTPPRCALFLLLAILAAVAGASALSVACREPLRVVAKVFTVLLRTALSAISIYALSPSFQAPSFSHSFLRSLLSLSALLVASELVSALIPTSPLLLPAAFALASRVILLSLAIAAAFILRHQRASIATESNIEKGSAPGGSSRPLDKLTPSHFFSRSSAAVGTACNIDPRPLIVLPLVLVVAQIFASLAAASSIAACAFVDAATNQPLPHILLVDATCTLLWSLMVLAIVQILPAHLRPCPSEEDLATGALRGDSGRFSRNNILSRTPKPSLSRRESDSVLDFLSLRDPFASPPPPPPPLPPVGLGLDEVDVGWSGNKEIGMQYRFPAPRSIINGGRRKGKNARASGKKHLTHQDSSRTLLPVPETRGTDTDAETDRDFGDEARLAQLLLESLIEVGQDSETPDAPTPVPTVQPPQAVHVPQGSRWSASTTVQSVVSASVSNRSGVSTYTTCASEKVPPSRVSMNTIASVLGSRKSSDARRKSAVTASSSKG